MVNLSFIPPALAGIFGLLLIGAFFIKPLKGFKVLVTGWAGKLGIFVHLFLIVLLLVFAGGSNWIGDTWNGVAGGNLQTGSLIGGDNNLVSAGAITDLTCRFATPTNVAPEVVTPGIKFRADPDSLNRYYADVQHVNGTASINGTLSCVRQGDIELAGRTTCYIKADNFRSETSTSDANIYYILATSSTASKIAGFPWAQTAYINDGAVATTASDRELTEVVFTGGASAEAQEDIGYYVTLPGATAWSYLNNQTSNSVHVLCNVNGADKEVATLVITKVSSTA